MANEALYMCPACGYEELPEPPWWDDISSLEICPCCGIQFGYDDLANKGGTRAEKYERWREKWKSEGFPWFSPSRQPPSNWSPERQVKNVGG